MVFWRGATNHIPLHTLPNEYPPLAILVFSLPLLPPNSDYHMVFGCWMAFACVGGWLLMAKYYSRRVAWIYLAYMTVGTGLLFLARFDIIPTLSVIAALIAVQKHRFSVAYLFLAVGTLLKLYPAFFFPLVVIEQWRWISGNDMLKGNLQITDLWPMRVKTWMRTIL